MSSLHVPSSEALCLCHLLNYCCLMECWQEDAKAFMTFFTDYLYYIFHRLPLLADWKWQWSAKGEEGSKKQKTLTPFICSRRGLPDYKKN